MLEKKSEPIWAEGDYLGFWIDPKSNNNSSEHLGDISGKS
jgi:hypothetical protein